MGIQVIYEFKTGYYLLIRLMIGKQTTDINESCSIGSFHFRVIHSRTLGFTQDFMHIYFQ